MEADQILRRSPEQNPLKANAIHVRAKEDKMFGGGDKGTQEMKKTGMCDTVAKSRGFLENSLLGLNEFIWWRGSKKLV